MTRTKEENKDMTGGSLWKKIILFSLPLIASNVLQVLFNMSDIAVVGKFAGEIALGAVGSTTTIVALFTGFLIGMGGGVNALAARYYGAQQYKELSKNNHTAVIICTLTGVALTVLGAGSAHAVLKLLKTQTAFLDGATLYLRIYFLCMPATAIYNFGNAVFSAAGNTKKPLLFLLIAGVINVALNLLFVIVFRLDVAGVAIASVISQYVSAFLILFSLFRAQPPYRMRFSELRIYTDKARDILSLGFSSGIQAAIFQLANLFTQVGVNSFDEIMVEGNSAAATADTLVYDTMAAFNVACTSFVGQNYGMNKKKRVLHSYFVALFYSFAAGLILGLLLVFNGKSFLSLFAKEPNVIEAGMKRLTLMGLAYWISAFMDVTISASRGLGKSTVPTVIVILGSCIFRIIWIYTVFAYFKTITSLYLLYPCSWTITAIAEIVYFITTYKKISAIPPQNQPLTETAASDKSK